MAGTRGTKASKQAATTVRLDRAALKRLDTIATSA
jgi:predicted transcriptional regulator